MLVFTQFREVIDPLAAFPAGIFRHPAWRNGGAKSQDARPGFPGGREIPFFVLSLKAGGSGLTLTAASHVVHFYRWWNPAVENQATDRAFRIGQKQNVLVHKFVCRGTVEEKIDALIELKRGLSNELLNGFSLIGAFETHDDEVDANELLVAQINGSIILHAERQIYARDDGFPYIMQHPELCAR